MIVHEPSTPLDFSETAVEIACSMMGVMPERTICYVSADYAAPAQLIREKYNCDIVLLPQEFLTTRDAWAVACPEENQFVWCRGI